MIVEISNAFLLFCVSISFNFPQVKEVLFYFIWNHFLFDVSSPSSFFSVVCCVVHNEQKCGKVCNLAPGLKSTFFEQYKILKNFDFFTFSAFQLIVLCFVGSHSKSLHKRKLFLGQMSCSPEKFLPLQCQNLKFVEKNLWTSFFYKTLLSRPE